MPSTPPTAQVTITLTPKLDAWLETCRDGPPILILETGNTELRLVLPSDYVTVEDVHVARRLADVMITFATQVAARRGRATTPADPLPLSGPMYDPPTG